MMKARKEVIDMITHLADTIALFCIENSWGVEERREVYRYGCEVLISALINRLPRKLN